MPKILRNRPFRVGWPGTAVGAGTSLLLAGWFLATASTTTLSAGPQATGAVAGRPADVNAAVAAPRATLNRYCVTCHNGRTKAAGLMLDGLDPQNVANGPEPWEKVVKKLRAGTMPPPSAPRPDDATRDALATWLETALDRAGAAHPNPGRPALHRLNRVEYQNAIRDLLALDVDAAALLPPDDSSYGFDNVADVLGVSPILIERYVGAAEKISALAVGDPAIAPTDQTYRVRFDLTQTRHIDGLPLGTRGGTVIHETFPLDGDYVIKPKLWRTNVGFIRGLAVLASGGSDRRRRARPPRDSRNARRFCDIGDGPAEGRRDVSKRGCRSVCRSRRAPGRSASPSSKRQGNVAHAAAPLPLDPRPGRFRRRAATRSRHDQRSLDGSRPRRHAQPPADLQLPARRRKERDGVCPADSVVARTARVPSSSRRVGFATADRLLRRWPQEAGLRRGCSAGARAPAERSQFVFRAERDPDDVAPGTAFRVSDLELASRLSFFLWSSIPDEPLLALASRGRLREPAVLDQQVARMMRRPARALAREQLRRAMAVPPQSEERGSPTKTSFRNSTTTCARRSAGDGAACRKRHARGPQRVRPPDGGLHVRERTSRATLRHPACLRQPVPARAGRDEARRGLFGQGSILTVTSQANRTSPSCAGNGFSRICWARRRRRRRPKCRRSRRTPNASVR